MENKCKECSYCNSPNSCKHCKVKGGRYDNFHPRKNKETSYLDFIPMFIQYAIGNTEEEKYSSAEKLAKIHFDKIIQEQKEKEEKEWAEYKKEYSLYNERKIEALKEFKPLWDKYQEELNLVDKNTRRYNKLKKILSYNKDKMNEGLIKYKESSASSYYHCKKYDLDKIYQGIFCKSDVTNETGRTIPYEQIKDFCDNIDKHIEEKYGNIEELKKEFSGIQKPKGYPTFTFKNKTVASKCSAEIIVCDFYDLKCPKNPNRFLDLVDFKRNNYPAGIFFDDDE